MDNKIIEKYISNEIERQSNEINLEKEKRKTILICLDIFSNKLNTITSINEDNTIVNDIEEIKKIIEKSDYNIFKKSELLNFLKDNNLELYNKNYKKFSKSLYNNTLEIDHFISKYLSMFLENYKTDNNSLPNNIDERETKDDNKIVNENDVNNIIKDNDTLVISDKDQLVYLPYTKEEILECQKKYNSSDINEIIKEFYTLPLSKFKYPLIARFREVFNLARKSKKSIPESFSLSIELYLENRLNPAVVAACKNFDELDIYLDYLESNELDKFDIFKIVFDSAPVIKK